jgi:hypothetical protein
MSKAILEFDLSDFDDKMAFERCIKSTDMSLVLFEMVYNMKKKLHYEFEEREEKGEEPTVYDGINSVFEKLNEQLLERGIDIDRIIV